MYHCDGRRFYKPDDSKTTGRLLKERNKLTFVDAQNKDILSYLVVGTRKRSQEQYFCPHWSPELKIL